MLFSRQATSIEVVRKQVSIWPQRGHRRLLADNPYLSRLVNGQAELFVAEHTLKRDDRRVRGEFAGAVLFKDRLPTVETPQNIAVAVPVRGTHDNRAYLAAVVSSEVVDDDVLENQDRHSVAQELASQAIFGYLSGELPAKKLFAAERREHVAQALWRSR